LQILLFDHGRVLPTFTAEAAGFISASFDYENAHHAGHDHSADLESKSQDGHNRPDCCSRVTNGFNLCRRADPTGWSFPLSHPSGE